MILTTADTLLSLEEFRRILQMHPYHFWQLADDDLVPVTSACDDLLFQWDWMNADAISRLGIIEAIRQAEQKLFGYLHFDLAPRYRTHIEDWPRFLNENLYRWLPADSTGRFISLRLPYQEIRSVGTVEQTLIGSAAVTLGYRPAGLPATFVATIATTITDPDQLAVYFAPADRYDPALPLTAWRIRPVSISISGGTATIRGSAWQLVRPELYDDPTTPNELDPTDLATYVASISVYVERVTSNGTTVDTAQAALIWETRPYPLWCDVPPSSSDPAAVGKAVARVGVRDAALGIVTPAQAVYDATAATWSQVFFSTGYEPDRVEVRTLAGLPLVNGQMHRYWQETIAWMALAELEGPICACESVRKRLHHWQFDLARTSGADDEAYGAISQADLSNPFGTRRGQVEAWHRVQPYLHRIGIAL